MMIFSKIIAKILVPIVLAVLIIMALQFLPWRQFGGSPPRQEINIHALAQQVLPAAEFVSLHYKYTELFEDKADNLRNIFGMRIPGTAREILVIAEGIVMLGIDCEKIRIEVTSYDIPTTLIVTLPPVKIISHEFDIRRIRDLSGVFVRTRLEEFPELMRSYKSEAELKVRGNLELYLQARISTESFFRQLFQSIPALESTNIEFEWETTVLIEAEMNSVETL
jgi:hypothetical protein